MKNIFTILLASLVMGAPASARQTSELWGEKGELWKPGESRLADFSTVGYMSGNEPIPDWPVGANVRDFGAVADDGKDDSKAFLDAIAVCPENHAVLVPKGRYDILQQLRIEKDHFVLRGEDMYKTVLFFPKNLTEIYSENEYDKSYQTGFFYVDGGTHRSIENMSFEFREQIKGDHWEFRGMDAIFYGGGVRDSWIRNLYIKNADHGIEMGGAEHISVLNIIFDHYAGRPDLAGFPPKFLHGWVGHVGIGMGKARYCLFHNIEFKGRYYHDFDIINVPSHSVVSNVKGTEMCLHHHGQGANHNLYTNVHAGTGFRDAVGGLKDSQRQKAETHWGIDADRPLDPAQVPLTTVNGHVFVGFRADIPSTITETLWYEAIDPKQLHPPNIYLAQLEYFQKPLPQGPPPQPPAPASADVVMLNPTDDNAPDSRNPESVKDPIAKSLPLDAFFKFDLGALDLRSVAKARFRVSAPKLVRTPITISVFSVEDDSWTQETLTATNAPAPGEELASATVSEEVVEKWLEFDITPFVQVQSKGDKVVSLKLQRTQGAGFNGTLRSREIGKAPLLILEQVESSVPGPPSAPTGGTATGKPGHIVLDWNDNPEADVDSYSVYRKPMSPKQPEFGAPVATGLVSSDFVDVDFIENKKTGDMPADVTFTYVVTAVDRHGYESAPGPEFVGTPLPVKETK